MSWERLNGFAPNSHGRRVWSLTGTSLNVKVKGQGHQGKNALCTPVTLAAMEWNTLAANNVIRQQSGHSVTAGGDFVGLRAVCVW